MMGGTAGQIGDMKMLGDILRNILRKALEFGDEDFLEMLEDLDDGWEKSWGKC